FATDTADSCTEKAGTKDCLANIPATSLWSTVFNLQSKFNRQIRQTALEGDHRNEQTITRKCAYRLRCCYVRKRVCANHSGKKQLAGLPGRRLVQRSAGVVVPG